MRYFVLENDFNIEVYEDRDEAIKDYNTLLSMMSDDDKSRLTYFRLYEVSKNPDGYDGDLIDIKVGDFIAIFK